MNVDAYGNKQPSLQVFPVKFCNIIAFRNN